MRRLPPLHALRAFEAAARHLHFSKAAEELALTPTAISHQVRQLEALLGVQLFHRYPRPVRLTADGAALYPVLRDALDEIAAKIAELSKSGDAEPLAVSVTLAFASRWLMPRLQRLQNETGLRITVEADDRIANLHGDTVDLAIRYCASPSSGGRWQRLFQDHFIPVAAPMLCPAGVEELAVHDIAKLPLIHYRWKNQTLDAPDWQKWFSFAIKVRTQIAVAQEFSEEVLAIDAAVAGQGSCLLPKCWSATFLQAVSWCSFPQWTCPVPLVGRCIFPAIHAKPRSTGLSSGCGSRISLIDRKSPRIG